MSILTRAIVGKHTQDFLLKNTASFTSSLPFLFQLCICHDFYFHLVGQKNTFISFSYFAIILMFDSSPPNGHKKLPFALLESDNNPMLGRLDEGNNWEIVAGWLECFLYIFARKEKPTMYRHI